MSYLLTTTPFPFCPFFYVWTRTLTESTERPILWPNQDLQSPNYFSSSLGFTFCYPQQDFMAHFIISSPLPLKLPVTYSEMKSWLIQSVSFSTYPQTAEENHTTTQIGDSTNSSSPKIHHLSIYLSIIYLLSTHCFTLTPFSEIHSFLFS